ncbi:MAG: zf-TFIIB domain-containing protein, partial [Bacteriovoracia bacterium]
PIIDKKEEKFTKELLDRVLKQKRMGVPKQEVERIVKCPKCHTSMNPVNYGGDSGVIIDRCPKSHGMWFDAHELESVQAYVEECQKMAKEKSSQWSQLATQAMVDYEKKRSISKNSSSGSFFSKLANFFFHY